MIAILIIALLIALTYISDKLWWKHFPTWLDDALSILVVMLIIVDGMLIGLKIAKMVGLL
jgi:uncharacterized protein (DUF983 family)